MSCSELGYVRPGMDGIPKPTDARFALAANLKELMARYNKGFGTGITPAQVEEGTGISYKTVKRILDPYSDISPNLETIDTLAAFFRIPSSELLQPRGSKVSGRERQTPAREETSVGAVQHKKRRKA